MVQLGMVGFVPQRVTICSVDFNIERERFLLKAALRLAWQVDLS